MNLSNASIDEANLRLFASDTKYITTWDGVHALLAFDKCGGVFFNQGVEFLLDIGRPKVYVTGNRSFRVQAKLTPDNKASLT